jgi:hypothetical protein
MSHRVFDRARVHIRKGFGPAVRLVRRPRSVVGTAVTTALVLPKTCPQGFGARQWQTDFGFSSDFDYPVASSGSEALRFTEVLCEDGEGHDLREFSITRDSTRRRIRASPSLIERDSVVAKTADLQGFKPSPGLEPGTASLPSWARRGKRGYGRVTTVTKGPQTKGIRPRRLTRAWTRVDGLTFAPRSHARSSSQTTIADAAVARRRLPADGVRGD